MASTNYTNDAIPNVSVSLNQVKSTSTSATIPFVPCIICKTPTGPIAELTPVSNYTEAISIFGNGNASTPALYGIQQYLKTYNYANIIRVAGSTAAEGEISLTRVNGDPDETITTTEYTLVTTYQPTDSYFINIDETYVPATKFNKVVQGIYNEVNKYSYTEVTSEFDPNETYYVLEGQRYVEVEITEFDPEVTYYTRSSNFDPSVDYYVIQDEHYVKVEIAEFEENVVYYTFTSNFDPTATYYTLAEGKFTTAEISSFDPEVDYYTNAGTAIDGFQVGINYYIEVTITEDTLGTIISGVTNYKTDSYNGDSISLVYNTTRNKWYITGTLNGVTYTTPKSTIDLSTATADVEEKVLDGLVNYWNALNTGITLKNEFINKVATDEAIDADDEITGTIIKGDSGNESISNEDVVSLFDLIEDPTVDVQDVVCAPEFRNYQIVNAGLNIKNTYFYIVSAEGKTLDEKEASIANYDASDKGVMYIPDGCIMADKSIVVPFEIAALYAWASTYTINRYYAPAGVKRATLDLVSKVVNNLTDDDALELYNQDIPANPVKYITNYGFVIYGQKTMDASQEFTNRINVANLVNYILITGRELLQPYLFDYAPISTFEKVYIDLYSMMNQLSINEVVYDDFKIVCDSSNNTDETLRKHELHASIAVRPINVVEYIFLDLTVTDEFGEGSEE